jgi:hypothetical protein
LSESEVSRSRPNPIGVAGALVAVLLPLVLVGYLGAGSASLWLDEITYYRLQGDLAFRAAEIGRSGSAVAPFFSNFFFCDLERAFQAPIVALGLIRPLEHPEWLVRALPIAAYAATALLIVLWRVRRGGDTATALLGGLLFAAAPIFLFYAFEGRVYAFVSLLAVALFMLLERASRSGGAGSLVLVAALGVVVARLHLWTVCLFASLLVWGVVEAIRRRRATSPVRAALASSVAGLGAVGLEYLYMRATQPTDPLFRLFERQPLGRTLEQSVLSIFSGPGQVQNAFAGMQALLFVLLCIVLLAVLVVATIRAPRSGEAFEAPDAAAVAAGALALSVALAVGFGYFVHGRYQVPLVATLFYAVARGLTTRRERLLALLLVTAEIVLLPQTASAIRAKSNNGEIARLVFSESNRSSTAVIVQNGVISGYPAPHHVIGLDFYLNDLHPKEAPIPIYELPDLRSTNGEHGTYRYFNGGEAMLARTLESPVARYRTWAAGEDRPDVWVVHPLWPVIPSEQQIADLLGVLTRESGFRVAARFVAPGYPQSEVVHLVRTSGR